MPFAVAAHMQLARYRRVLGRILREEAHPIGCCVVKPTGAWYIQARQRPAQDLRGYTEAASGPTRCRVEGGFRRDDWYDLCVRPRWLWCTPVVLVAGVGVLSCPEIN